MMTSWCEVSAANLLHNLRILKNLTGPETKILGVVKSNAYGHGLETVARTTAPETHMFGVHSATEAIELNALHLGVPILVMGFVTRDEVASIGRIGAHLLISTEEVLEGVAEDAPETPVHLKVDTGTHRQGIQPDEIDRFVRMASDRRLSIVGIATHFANIEDTTDHSYARKQQARFSQAVSRVRDCGMHPHYVHSACSAAALLFPETHHTLIRAGISLYGHWPSRETLVSWKNSNGGDFAPLLKPCLTWITRVGQIQHVSRGEPIGYGCSYRTSRDSLIAVLPTGYAAGYDRKLSNRGSVLIRGPPAPVVGRVCMNLTMVDVTDIEDVSVGGEAVLLGRQCDEEITVEELADIIGTINYEVLARISPDIPRILT